MGLLRERCTGQGRVICGIVAIRYGRKMVGGFHGMLLPSAKHSRSIVWWEDTPWKTVRSTIEGPGYSVRSDGRISPYFWKRPVATASIRSKSLARYFPWMCVARGRGRIWKGDILVADIEEFGTDGRIWNPCKRTQCKESVNAYERWKVHIPNRRWNSQTLWRRSGSENLGSPRPRRRTRKFSRRIRRIFFKLTWRLIVVWWWSWEWFLVHFRQFFLPSSRGTQSQTLLADWRIIPSSTEIHRRDQGYECILGCFVGEKHRRLLERWWRSKIVRYMERFHKIQYFEWKTTGWIYMVREETYKETNHLKTRHFVARDLERCPMHQNVKRSKSEQSKNQISTMPEDCAVFTSLILIWGIQGCHEKCAWKIGKSDARCDALQTSTAQLKNTRQSTLLFLKPMHLWGNAWKDLPTRIMKIILQDNGSIHWVTTIWCANLFLCLKLWKFPQQRQQWTRNGNIWRKFRRGTWRKSEVRKRWSMKQGIRAAKFILRHWWISVILRIRSWSLNIKGTKAGSYSKVTL